ncbi:hypothetical protein [Caulobacter henricii]|uniref:Uncharacterized protein n=1 Tax=Caulobacter henricii TaxID=69395 RepID=A0A0P0P126_9CAUL|nr:hypothetical protein [Caulobacter henricii]ALL14145.1 hypothetical protein AQ619_12795 [Caulobacter henricii]
MKTWSKLAVLVLLAVPMPAVAADASKAATPAVLKALFDCRSIVADTERLACYDAAVGQVNKAEKTGEVIIVDRQQARAARRQAFGLELSALSILDRSEEKTEVDRVIGEVVSARQGADGRWTIVLADGAVWKQVDDSILSKNPKKGSKAEIRKASMGSYFMNIDGQRAVRARRADTQ